MTHIGIISVDGHVRAPWDVYRSYIDPQWRGDFDDWVKHLQGFPDYCHPEINPVSQWDFKRRVADHEARGVVAEVLFPNGMQPLEGRVGNPSRDAVRAGYKAYNRWVADACSTVPGRMFPQAFVDFSDVKLAVEEIHAAKEQGFVGILMPPFLPDSRCFFDPNLDPIWAACAETGLPISQHGGDDVPTYKPQGETAFLVLAMEQAFYANRSLWQFILGGVFDRFPKFKVAYIESGDWLLRPAMHILEKRHKVGDDWMKALNKDDTRPYRRPPSEYLRTNVYIGISPFVSTPTVASFDDGNEEEFIVTSNSMIGVDYPHAETALFELRDAVDQFTAAPNVTEEGARKVICENAARLFGIDLASLKPHMERVGFELNHGGRVPIRWGGVEAASV
jgi:predicted TIM-barrel fold metal-dependent hydrolase